MALLKKSYFNDSVHFFAIQFTKFYKYLYVINQIAISTAIKHELKYFEHVNNKKCTFSRTLCIHIPWCRCINQVKKIFHIINIPYQELLGTGSSNVQFVSGIKTAKLNNDLSQAEKPPTVREKKTIRTLQSSN